MPLIQTTHSTYALLYQKRAGQALIGNGDVPPAIEFGKYIRQVLDFEVDVPYAALNGSGSGD
ncbi:hypothetical protein ERN12_08065 [Rhodobacteraceae bacterium]|nr:hypothetical protein ERN12_08065 [Paracoccaceae bacterium]